MRVFSVIIYCLLGAPLLANPRALTKAELPMLVGHWHQECLRKNVNKEFFRQDDVEYSEIYFGDEECQTPLIAFSSSGLYQLETRNINFQFTGAFVEIFSPDVVADFNQRVVCGWADWVTNSRRSILNQSCDFFNLGRNYPAPKAGQWKFGIYQLSEGKLYFGQLTLDHDGSTPEKRPENLNPRAYVPEDSNSEKK